MLRPRSTSTPRDLLPEVRTRPDGFRGTADRWDGATHRMPSPHKTASYRHARARLAADVRWNPEADHSELENNLAAESLIAFATATAPDLTDEQAERLRRILGL